LKISFFYIKTAYFYNSNDNPTTFQAYFIEDISYLNIAKPGETKEISFLEIDGIFFLGLNF